jgi:RNA-directed DNA polymerase
VPRHATPFGRSGVKTPAPLSVQEAEQRVLGWQTKLHRWAAQDAQARFGDLFNLVCDPATLLVAWERVKRNRGSRTAGVDGQTRARVEQIGVEGVLAELRQELKDGTYRPLPARERLIPKRSGKLRSLGISTVRDRIVQTAAKVVLEPIFEADFCPTSYGFRPGRRAQDAVEEVRFFINAPRSYEWVIEGDVEDCFGSIHHGLLMEQVRGRVTDKRVLRLIRRFLAAGIMHEHGSLTATPSGTPQGSALSPLLANIALSVLDRHFEAAWPRRRHERARDRAQGRPSYRMIRYADDFVVLVRGTEAQAHAIKEQTAAFMREHMQLTLSPEKTRVTHDDGFDLLGFRIVRRPWKKSKRVAYSFPSQRALREIMHRIKTLTNRSTLNLSLDQLIHALNPVLRGWANHYRHAASSRCFAYLSHYLWWRVIRWLRKKYPRLTWKQIRRRCWGHHWTSREGTRLAWPDEVPVTRYHYRGHYIPSPWTATGTGRATTRPGTAAA